MTMNDSAGKRQWGKTRIAGGRHAYRMGLLLREVKKRVGEGSAVLDAGCGDGAMAIEMHRRGFRVSAVDASDMCIAKLKASLDELGLAMPGGQGSSSTGPFYYCRSGLESLPFPDAGFDAVVSGEVVEHLDDDSTAAREIARVLKPGGIAVISVPRGMDKWGVEDEWAGHKRRYTAETLTALFAGAGMKSLEVRAWGFPVTYFYTLYLFRPWLKKKIAAGEANFEPGAAAHPLVANLMSAVFSLDNLFTFTGRGLGLIGVFQKL